MTQHTRPATRSAPLRRRPRTHRGLALVAAQRGRESFSAMDLPDGEIVARKRLPTPLRRARRGQSLVEFAMVALVVYLLLAAILTFGHALYVAQGLQQAADLAAREIARTPLGADATFKEVLTDGSLGPDGANIYSEDYLVYDLNLNDLEENQSFFHDIVQDWPLLNRQLATLMIVDNSIPGRRLLRYPGALLTSDTAPTGLTVGIPLVMGRDDAGIETIRWVPVVEEIEPRSFRIDSERRGIVALRINYPFQSASMSSFRVNDNDPFAPTIGSPHAADDGAVTELNPDERPGGFVAGPVDGSQGFHAGTYGGQYGLGAQGAFGRVDEITGGRPVRPFRRVISAQAIYRREIFD
ncbi:MAG: pilus assembly protein [Planctomycetaceae bacterium]|nr:MAG: pilus assembly protein [Planctomycetaceae bacterium]